MVKVVTVQQIVETFLATHQYVLAVIIVVHQLIDCCFHYTLRRCTMPSTLLTLMCNRSLQTLDIVCFISNEGMRHVFCSLMFNTTLKNCASLKPLNFFSQILTEHEKIMDYLSLKCDVRSTCSISALIKMCSSIITLTINICSVDYFSTL